MEGTLLILNSFTNLTKLEHHRNFFEFCKGVNVIPTGLSLKKIPSLCGKASPNFDNCPGTATDATHHTVSGQSGKNM